MAASGRLQSVAFEVFGKVQGVFFRKHTQETALKKGVKGFVKNTPRGTVVGVLEGPAEAVESMKQWLSKEGSPSSRIDQCVFNNERALDAFTYSEFSIVRRKKTA